MPSLHRSSLLSCLLVLVLGCGDSSLSIAPVSGRVTLDGKPLAGARVVYQPIASPGSINPGIGSFGKTDDEGRYTLRLVDPDGPGAALGKHRVFLSTAEAKDPSVDLGPTTREKIPTNARGGKLIFEVSSDGTDQANFDLKSH